MKPRNFWIESLVNGKRKETIKGARFCLIIKMRDKGKPKTVASVTGYALKDNKLMLDLWQGITRVGHIETKK